MSSPGFDLIVIGAGAMGLAVADRFARRHPDTAVLVCRDTDHPDGSTAAGAMIVAWSETTAQARQQTGFTDRLADAEHSVRYWREELADAEVDGSPIITASGLNVVLSADALRPEIDNFAAIRAVLRERGVAWESVDVDVVTGFDPVGGVADTEALYLPEEFVVDSRLLDVWRRRRLVEAGVAFATGRFRPVERDGRVIGVAGPDGELIGADVVVVAAGSASRALTPDSVRDRIPPLYAGVGTAATVDPGPSVPVDALRTPNRAFACGLHLLPTATGDVYIGATNEPRTTTPRALPEVGDVEYLLRCAVHQVNRDLKAAALTGLRVGARPIPADAVPLVGPVVPGLWLATGFNRDGLTRSLDVADRLVAAVDGDTGALPERWRPVRPPVSVWTADDALAHAVANSRAMAEESDKRLDNPRWDEAEQSKLIAEYETLYRDEGPVFVLPPDLIGLAGAGSLPMDVRSWTAAWGS